MLPNDLGLSILNSTLSFIHNTIVGGGNSRVEALASPAAQFCLSRKHRSVRTNTGWKPMLLCAVARSLWVRGHPCRALSLPGPNCPESNVAKASSLYRLFTAGGLEHPQRLPTPLRPARSRRAKYRLEAYATLRRGSAKWVRGHPCRALSLLGPNRPESNVA